MKQCIVYKSKHFMIKDLGEASSTIWAPTSRTRKGQMHELNQCLYVKTIAEGFEVTKTGILPTTAASVLISKVNGLQTDAGMEEMQGTYVGVNYDAPRYCRYCSHGREVSR